MQKGSGLEESQGSGHRFLVRVSVFISVHLWLIPMKLILAIIQPSKLEAVKEALNKVEVFRLTIVDVHGFGRQKGHSEVYRAMS